MRRSGPPPRLGGLCPTCGGIFPYTRGTKGGRAYITPRQRVVRNGRFRYFSVGRPGPSTTSIRVYYPSAGGRWFRCPNDWHQHWHGNPKQEQSRRTSPARPSSEVPGRAEVERRRRAKALRHKARQDKARR